ncbi:uncharacterized protein BDZ99DRAFT_462122 [Mytilinidion resinicola]|uniref:GST C-terminal domain-containing protein n=1 Tax=Mytilinidion resinicola TaxID=574789 RepID=A0A6A6YRY1_9PEZI|nr:uncharacterized protein BDZ99DRAFT_462122 [Mytilinidion resinicola]KAF2810804.1 hypothetical protein BDZ99DRAFT_462122 [Mytilinidion resinicola]
MMLMQSLGFESSGSAGPYAAAQAGRFEYMLKLMDAQLAKNDWLAGDEFAAADIMTVFTFTTMRPFYPSDLTSYEGILGYLGQAVQREGHKRSRAKADPKLELMVDGEPPRSIWERL